MTDFKEIIIKAFHLKKSVDIRELKERVKQNLVGENKSELFYEWEPGKYVLIFNYGVYVFYNFSDREITEIFENVFLQRPIESLIDQFSLVPSNSDEINIRFNSLSLKVINREVIKIIMLNLAQSLALHYYDQHSQELLIGVKQFTNQMVETGKLKIRQRNILKLFGSVLSSKNKIAENLYIFDAPAITWNDEYLDKINSVLSRHFDLGPRYKSIENTFDIVETNLRTFMDLYHQKESSRLEWIIIILILVEVLDTFISKFL